MKHHLLAFITWLAIFVQPILCAQDAFAGRIVMLCDQFGVSAEFIESDTPYLQNASDCQCPSIIHSANPSDLLLSEFWSPPVPRTEVLVTPSTSTYSKSLARAPPAE
ncbi:hypothetical protein [Salinibius halmophilus]|uniref:hypothetical protein n=1 Tax=Salinibius halmophilus TaxID=1853216 RepID=UPI000E666DBF|nr:hypothetical protein [Salinibius halmophilus]